MTNILQPQRNSAIDIMRLISLFLIIMAHTISPYSLIFQLRNFDVPMIVIISGMSFYLSSNKKSNLQGYLFQRILRLILPTWVFLSLFFSISFLYSYFLGTPFSFDGKVLGSFLLFQGESSIGYVWIIRVFLLITLANPFLLSLYSKLHTFSYTSFLILVYLCYEFSIKAFPFGGSSFLDVFIHQYIYYLIPYSLLSGIGIMLVNLNQQFKKITTVLLFILLLVVIFFTSGLKGFTFFPQDFKYPAHNYYLFWGLFMSFLLYLLSSYISVTGFFKKILHFFNGVSLWFYFWHIFVLHILSSFSDINLGFVNFTLVLSLSLILTSIHKFLFLKIFLALQQRPQLQHWVKITFLI